MSEINFTMTITNNNAETIIAGDMIVSDGVIMFNDDQEMITLDDMIANLREVIIAEMKIANKI